MRIVVLACLAAGCWTSSKKAPPPQIANTAKPAPPAPAKYIRKTAAGGVIELGGDRGIAMEAANTEMAKHCGSGNYIIVQEGEEAIGDDPCAIDTAWRVHYQCGN